MYIKMSEILIIWLSALVLQMAPYLIFILLQKSTHSVNIVLYSQNARLCRNCALIRPTIRVATELQDAEVVLDNQSFGQEWLRKSTILSLVAYNAWHIATNYKEKRLFNTMYLKYPWTKVASDLFTLYGHDYVIIADYTSKYIEIERLTDKSSQSVINKIMKIFARHGTLKELLTDNGPEYTAQSFKHFTEQWDFRHVTSSPHFPQSNGFVERAI